MSLFRGTSAGHPEADLPWFIEWRDVAQKIRLNIPLRVGREINQICNGSDPAQIGVLLGSAEAPDRATRAFEIFYALRLAMDVDGHLASSARDQLAACCPSPEKRVTTMGIFMRVGAGAPEAICKSLAACTPLFPSMMLVLVVPPDGTASVYMWDTETDKIRLLSPGLHLGTPPIEQDEYAAVQVPQNRDALETEPTIPVKSPPPPPIIKAAPSNVDLPPPGLNTRRKVPRPTPPPRAADPLPPEANTVSKSSQGVTVQFELPRWVWVGMLVLAGCTLAGVVWIARTSRSSTDTTSQPPSQAKPATFGAHPLGIQVSRQSNDLIITWDRNAPILVDGRGGTVQIKDGTQVTDLTLSAKDLTSGQVFYAPRSADIHIELTVFTASGAIGETVRVIQAGTSSARNDIQGGLRVSNSPRQAMPAASAARASNDRQLPELESSNLATTTAEDDSNDSVRKVFIPPPQNSTRARLQTPPGTIRSEAAPKLEGQPRPEIVVPPVTAQAPMMTPIAPKPEASAAPVPIQHSVLNPPLAIRQSPPVLPPAVKSMLFRDMFVEVRVQIDTQGKVTSAEPNQGSTFHNVLGRAAADAAKEWRFRPATLNGKPVPSDQILRFKFSRTSP